jgi:hypothetical protein
VIPDDVPKELVDAIKGGLGYANGHTLNRKLSNMLNGLSDETCRLFCVDKTTFIKGIVDTRNYNTHYSAKSRLLQGIELHWASRKLSLMLRVLLLLKAGIAEVDIQAMIRPHPRLSQERGVWRNVSEEGSPLAVVEVD